MSLEPGTRLGPYVINAPLGVGGMGEVYKATDTRLERTVAIKVLPAHVASDPERKQRFEREAKTISSLNHPHICTLHDVGREGHTDFLVMEYLEGETLADRLHKGALPLDQALKYAIQIADALDKAHRQGVTHRDLKPANIMLTKAGAKLLDFGLAKLKPIGPQSEASTKLADSLTEQGTILGTFQYMAPEQLEGKDADARTDIWAFGCVVYEMITGKKAFEGKSQASLIAAIIEREPLPVSSVEPMTPAGLDYVVKTCLGKDSDDRWQTARDLLRELKRVESGGVVATESAMAVPQPAVWQRPVPAMVVAVFLMVLSGLVVWTTTRTTPPQLTRTLITTPPDEPVETRSSGVDMAISRDGRQVIYTSVDFETLPQLMMRALDEFEATVLLSGSQPFFSPDGNWVGFVRGGTLRKVSALGGPAVTICESQGVRGASWGRDDTIIFATGAEPRGLWRVAAAGGEPELLSAPDTEVGEYSHLWPEILPGGEAVLFNIFMAPNEPETAQIAVLSLDTGEYDVLIPSGGSNPRYVSTGHLIYAVNDSLRAIRFDLDRLEIIGTPVPVLEHVMVKRQGAANFGVSLNGSLVYIAGAARDTRALDSILVWVDKEGRTTPVTDYSANYHLQLRVSPDGMQIATVIESAGSADIWIYDVERGTRLRLTSEGSVNNRPVWTADGAAVIFQSNRTGDTTNLFSKLADGSGEAQMLLDREGRQYPDSLSADGLLAFQEGSPRDIWVLPPDGEPQLFLSSRFSERQAAFSPDGRVIAYISDESGRYDVYVQPYPGPGGKIPISVDGGQEPVWSPDGRELFFRTATHLMAVEITTLPMSVGSPRVLFETGTDLKSSLFQTAYDVSPDGERFLMSQLIEEALAAPEIHVVQNWFSELERLVPTP